MTFALLRLQRRRQPCPLVDRTFRVKFGSHISPANDMTGFSLCPEGIGQ
jgi:hypothetical protein